MTLCNPANPDHVVLLVGNTRVENLFHWSVDGGRTWHAWETREGWLTAIVDYSPYNWKSPGYHYDITAGATRPVVHHLVDFLPGDPRSVVMWGLTPWQKGPLRSDDYGERISSLSLAVAISSVPTAWWSATATTCSPSHAWSMAFRCSARWRAQLRGYNHLNTQPWPASTMDRFGYLLMLGLGRRGDAARQRSAAGRHGRIAADEHFANRGFRRELGDRLQCGRHAAIAGLLASTNARSCLRGRTGAARTAGGPGRSVRGVRSLICRRPTAISSWLAPVLLRHACAFPQTGASTGRSAGDPARGRLAGGNRVARRGRHRPAFRARSDAGRGSPLASAAGGSIGACISSRRRTAPAIPASGICRRRT